MDEDRHTPSERNAEFRFYAELNDFLSHARRGRSFVYGFRGTPSVKSIVESLGVPHTEIDLILVDGDAVGFTHRLLGDERVAVFPVFERFDVSRIGRLRPEPLRKVRFIADVHLGKLARYLRMLGFDTHYDRRLDDDEIIELSRRDHRIILTRDRSLLRDGRVSHAYMVRASGPRSQLREVVDQFQLSGRLSPFTRCMCCNGIIEPVGRRQIGERVPPAVLESKRSFSQCQNCRRVYWEGTHVERMRRLVNELGSPRRAATGTARTVAASPRP